MCFPSHAADFRAGKFRAAEILKDCCAAANLVSMPRRVPTRIEPDGKLGPAMRALNDRQRAFVRALFDQGWKISYTRAAKAAGYADGGSLGGLRVQAHRLAHDEAVVAAVQEEGRRRLELGTIAAAGRVLAEVGNKDANIALKAAGMLMDRGGLHAMSEHRSVVEHRSSDDAEVLKRVVAKARQLGLDPQALLGRQGIVVDADFEMIEEKTDGNGG